MENTKFLKGGHMKSFHAGLLLVALLFASGCSKYPGITGKVVENTTGKPIAGALVVAQWTKKHGLGLTYHTLSLITETLTDKDGEFSIPKTPDEQFVEPPIMIIYKGGYIPWRNDSIFPSCNLVKNNEWSSNVTYKLDVLADNYTARQVDRFMDYGVLGRDRDEVPIFSELMNNLARGIIKKYKD